MQRTSWKRSLCALVLVLLLAGIGSACGGGQVFGRYKPLPEAYRRNGLISSSTYQVYVTVFGDSEEEARVRGEQEGQSKAIELLLKEPFMSRFNYEKRKNEMVNIVRRHGRVVRVAQESENTWGVVYHITQKGSLRRNLTGL